MTIHKLFTTILCLACYHLHSTAGLTNSTSSQVVPQTHKITKRVVGGVDCAIEEFPYLVSFRKPKSKSLFCTGSLITLRWALTAAHCFEKTAVLSSITSGSIAVIGTTQLKISDEDEDEDTSDNIQRRKVHLVYIHHLYDSLPSFRHDLAMVQLDKHFELSDWLHMPVLPRHGETDRCTTAVVPGWATQVGLHKSLKCAHNTTISTPAACQSTWQWEFVSEKTICAADLEGESIGPCYEDAGSPLICQNLNVSNVIVGIFSQTKGCDVPKQHMLYARVDAYLKWIDDTMNNGAQRMKSCPCLILMLLVVMLLKGWIF